MGTMLRGIVPAVASPCDENDVFLEARFAALLSELYAQGIDGVYICGATGDGPNMRLEERKRAADIAVAASREYGGTVIVHVGASNTRDATELAAHAARAGATAVSSMPPANRSHAQLVSYYTEVARAARIPVLVYHIPMLTHHTPTVDELLELLDIDGVVGLKLTDWNLFFMKRLLLARPDAIVFSGYDEFLAPALLYGARGGIGTWYNLFPRAFIGIYQAAQRGDYGRAMQIQECLLAFQDLAWRHGVAPLFEHLLRERGFGPYCFRRPRVELDRETLDRIAPELQARLEAIEQFV